MENRIWRRTMVYTWAMFLAIVWATVGLLYQVTNDLQRTVLRIVGDS